MITEISDPAAEQNGGLLLMKKDIQPGEESVQVSRRLSLNIIAKKMRSRFHVGWMLTFSLIFCGLLLLAFNGVEALTSFIISSSGHAALTSGDYSFFFRSWQGYVTIAILLITVPLVISIVLNGIILLSYDLLQRRYTNPFRIFIRSIRSIRLFLCKKALPIVLYYIVFISFFVVTILALVPNPSELPGYLRYMLSKNLVSVLLYAGALLLVSIPLIYNPLIVHDMLIGQEGPEEAVSRTLSFVKTNRRKVFKEIFISVLFIGISLLISGAVFLYLPLLCQTIFSSMPAWFCRIAVLTATYLGLTILSLTVLLSPWVLPVTVSSLYQEMLASDSRAPEPADEPARQTVRKSMLFFYVMLAVFITLFIAAVIISYQQFNYIYPPAKNIEAVVHRLGGDMDTENTLEGLAIAIADGAPAAETDIQRTKDGEYVIFHDSTLKRMCGMSSRISDLTLEEVQQLTLPSPVFEEERRIPLLSEVLDQAKGKIRLYLELKGSTADQKMAHDVYEMVRERGMVEDCVLISMNYKLISYINTYLPDISCGYLYFFAYGMESRLAGNLLMAQSNAINSSRTRAIHSQGKKVYCWTVNSMMTAQNMVRQRVDGIITDRYDIVNAVLSHMESRNDYERIMDVLLM